jgi:NDP-sugar pyrophosphorylase family protein
MEALILAGGKAERLGDAAAGRPKALVPVAGHPLAAYQVSQLAAAGVGRVIVACASGQESFFASELAGLGPEILPVGEPEPLGRGGGLRFAAAHREESGPLFALNGDELLDVDLGALLALHRERRPAGTIVVTRVHSPFGVVDVDEEDLINGFREAPVLPQWVSAGVYVLDDEALARLPERGDHETTTFPDLAAEGKLLAFKHAGAWLTVNTPKDLRRAEEHFAANPGWRPVRVAPVG